MTTPAPRKKAARPRSKPQALRVDLAKPPAHLSAGARELWRRLTDEYNLADAGGLALLRVVAECFDRAEFARVAIEREGATMRDRFGQSKPHPLLSVERDARASLVSAIRAMRLAPDNNGADA